MPVGHTSYYIQQLYTNNGYLVERKITVLTKNGHLLRLFAGGEGLS